MDYLAGFRRIADRTEYDEEAKHAALITGLSNEIQQALFTVDLSRSLEETVATIQKIDNKIRAFAARTPRTQTPTPASTFTGTTLGPRPKPAQVFPSSATVSAHPTAATSSGNSAILGGEPMDLSIGRACGPLTPAERARRITNNLCMYCGDANHYAGNCPKANRKTQLRGMTVPQNRHLPPTPEIPALPTQPAENL